MKEYGNTVVLFSFGAMAFLGMFFYWQHQQSMQNARSAVAKKAATASLPQTHPLFDRATKVLTREASWDWGGGGEPEEYRWISDTELFYPEYRELQPGSSRIMQATLYRYNLRTHTRTRLTRLNRLVDCFYHSQIEVSPDGKWLLWHGGTADHDTIDVATLEGKHHRQGKGGYWTEHRLSWAEDSLHWVDLQKESSGRRVVIHEVMSSRKGYGPALFKVDSDSDVVISENGITSVSYPDVFETVSHIIVQQTPLSPSPILTHTCTITAPAQEMHPIIVDYHLSPDGKRIALIVGYDKTTRIGKSIDEASYEMYSLWVCRTDGTEMHPIGIWQEEIIPPHDDERDIELNALRWLPSGERLSFIYKGTLYTIPVD